MQEPSSPETPAPNANAWRAVRFVALFVAIVLILLTGYRYAINTYANQRYLYIVAQNTSWLLDLVGYRSELESPGAFKGYEASIRSEIAAMERGENPPVQFPTGEASPDTSQPPLTPWEQWHYRALRMLVGWPSPEGSAAASQAPGTLRDQGPIVHFILEPSLTMKLDKAEHQLAQVRANTSLTEAQKQEKIANAQEKVDRLSAALREQNAQPQEGGKKDGKDFRFKVVPDCGAIEVMAIFVAAVLAFPAPWLRKLIGLLLGLPLLYALNIVRLAFLAFVGAWTDGGEVFDFAHHYVWQGIYIIFVVALWLAWMEFIVRRKTT